MSSMHLGKKLSLSMYCGLSLKSRQSYSGTLEHLRGLARAAAHVEQGAHALRDQGDERARVHVLGLEHSVHVMGDVVGEQAEMKHPHPEYLLHKLEILVNARGPAQRRCLPSRSASPRRPGNVVDPTRIRYHDR